MLAAFGLGAVLNRFVRRSNSMGCFLEVCDMGMVEATISKKSAE